jgi:hypothetical protein
MMWWRFETPDQARLFCELVLKANKPDWIAVIDSRDDCKVHCVSETLGKCAQWFHYGLMHGASTPHTLTRKD